MWGPGATGARRSLQWQVWQLRRLLGPQADRLVYRAPGYLLRVEPGELDLARFQDLADRGRELLAAGDGEEAGRLLGPRWRCGGAGRLRAWGWRPWPSRASGWSSAAWR